MARYGVTFEDVSRVAEQLANEGKQPTIEQIRHLLGTGSTTTIANHLRKWRAEQEGSITEMLCDTLPQEFVTLMKNLWQRLQTHADTQIVSVRQQSEITHKQLQAEIEKYKNNNHRWQKMYETWNKEKISLTDNTQSLEQKITSMQKEANAMQVKQDASAQQIAEKQQRIDELHRLHKLAQDNLEHYRESMRVQRISDQEKQMREKQQFEVLLKDAAQEKNTLQTRLDKSLQEHAHLQNAHEKLQGEWTLLQSVYTKMDAAQNDVRKQHQDLLDKYNHQQSLMLEQQKQHISISEQLNHARNEIAELQEQNKQLAEEKWQIAQEKSQLQGVNQQLQKMVYAEKAG